MSKSQDIVDQWEKARSQGEKIMPPDWWPDEVMIVAKNNGFELAVVVQQHHDSETIVKSLLSLLFSMWKAKDCKGNMDEPRREETPSRAEA